MIWRYQSRNRLLSVAAGIICVLGIFVLSVPAAGADFPKKSITMLCGSTAGSPVDVMARELARHMEKILKKPVVVQNKPGGSQAEELATILGQPADGYIIGTVTTSTAAALAGHLRAQFKKEDFNFLSLVQSDPYAIAVRADSPFKDLKEMVDFAKANPGKIKIGGFGTGSGHHMAFLDLADKMDVQMKWVSFDGGRRPSQPHWVDMLMPPIPTPAPSWGMCRPERCASSGLLRKNAWKFSPAPRPIGIRESTSCFSSGAASP